MTEQEYNLEIKHCQKLTRGGDTQEALRRLEDLYKVKPVRLTWYVTKAEYLWKTTGKVKPAFELLSGKGWNLFPYPGLKEMDQLYFDLVNSYKDIPDARRHRLIYLRTYGANTEDEVAWLQKMQADFQEAKTGFIENPVSEAAIKYLLDFYLSYQDYIMFFLLSSYIQHLKFNINIGRKWMLQFTNSGYLAESLEDGQDAPFLLVEDETSDGLDYEIAAYILQKLQKKVYLLKAPVTVEVDRETDIEQTVEASMDTLSAVDGLYTVWPARIVYNGEELGDNREYILSYLAGNDFKNQAAVILTSGILMDNLCCQPVLKKNLERLRGVSSPAWETQMTFGWLGSYLSYISTVHDMDAEKLLEEPASLPFSIILPARNSARTLRYTLMTCLNQRYKGDYEVVLSDNSSPGNMEVYQLYKELDDPRIRYYRTPREYNLSRSFEFAFLHAKGEFVLSLGSDDALLPWALDTLDSLRKEYPDEDIIQWERGFYAWPGFNGGQQHQFVIPRDYQKGKYQPRYCSREYYFSSILSNSSQMYLLPNLYLNSGCKRSYLKMVLEKTGRLFDGICQDIYMGVVNAAVNEKVLNIQYPLVVAGMAGGSMGAKANMVYEPDETETAFLNELKKTADIGAYSPSPYERLMPEVTTDKSSLYNCILRMIARGVILESDLGQVDFRGWFLDVYSQMDIRDPLFDKKIHYFCYTAALHGDDFLKWFDENIYHNAFSPRRIDEEKIVRLRDRKCYTEGTNQYGSRTLDASKYGVKNVYDAALLFERLSNL